MKVFYSPEALGDLQRLREFLASKNPQAARKAAARIIQGVKQLSSFPLLGTEVSRAPNPEVVRDLVVGKYVVRYLVGSAEIYILRIWHHKERRGS